MSKRNLERRVRPLLFMIESVGMGKELGDFLLGLWSAVYIPPACRQAGLREKIRT
jgi:hypothetical protein